MNLKTRRFNKVLELINNGNYHDAVEKMISWMNKIDRVNLVNSTLASSHYNLFKEALMTHSKKMKDFMVNPKNTKLDLDQYIRDMSVEMANQNDSFYATFCEVRALIARDLLKGNYKDSLVALGYISTDDNESFIKNVAIQSMSILWPNEDMVKVLYS